MLIEYIGYVVSFITGCLVGGLTLLILNRRRIGKLYDKIDKLNEELWNVNSEILELERKTTSF